MKRLTTIISASLIVMGGGAVAQDCTTNPSITIGFKDRNITLYEGQSKTLEVTAELSGDFSEADLREVKFSLDTKPIWQKGQVNESPVGGEGGASLSDFNGSNGTLSFGEGYISQQISVNAVLDNEKEQPESYYANLSIDFEPNPTSTHRSKEETCRTPSIGFRHYGYFATINIRDGECPAGHWLYGSNC